MNSIMSRWMAVVAASVHSGTSSFSVMLFTWLRTVLPPEGAYPAHCRHAQIHPNKVGVIDAMDECRVVDAEECGSVYGRHETNCESAVSDSLPPFREGRREGPFRSTTRPQPDKVSKIRFHLSLDPPVSTPIFQSPTVNTMRQ